MTLVQLADGRQYDPVAKKVVGGEETSESSAPALSLSPRPKVDLRISDMTVPARQVNVLAAAIVYEMLKFPDIDLKYAFACSQEQLDTLRMSDAYQKLKQHVHEAILFGLSEDARSLIASHATSAAETVVNIMRSSKSEVNKLKAAETILNRAGIQNDEHTTNDGNALVIKVVKGDAPVNVQITANG